MIKGEARYLIVNQYLLQFISPLIDQGIHILIIKTDLVIAFQLVEITRIFATL